MKRKMLAKGKKLNLRIGPLDGVPISWKDLFDVAGHETTAGSDLLKGRIPKNDCAILKLASINGLVTLGKTHMSELAFSGLGLNPITQTPLVLMIWVLSQVVLHLGQLHQWLLVLLQQQ